MKKIIALSVLFGCGHISVDEHGCPWSRADEALVGAQLRADWIRSFNEDPGPFDSVTVSCLPPYERPYEQTDDPDDYIFGLTLSPHEVWVRPVGWSGEVLGIDQTSLRHEYIHIGLWRLSGSYFGPDDDEWRHRDVRWVLQ